MYVARARDGGRALAAGRLGLGTGGERSSRTEPLAQGLADGAVREKRLLALARSMSYAWEATASSEKAQPLPVGLASVLDPSGGDMRYCGMDVHGKATVYCLLDAQGNV